MAPKHGSLALVSEPDPAAEALAILPRRVSALDQLTRRVVGDGLVNALRARAEVLSTLDEGYGELPASRPVEDALPARIIPSVAAGSFDDRTLAEIDHDGFAFAQSPIDAPFFDRRARRAPRPQNLLDVALVDGRVCIRKRYRGLRLGARRWGDQPVPLRQRLHLALWNSLGLFLYSEAAALLRLRDLPFVPKLRRIDLADRAIYVDYLQGENLRSIAARSGAAVHDTDLKMAQLNGMSGRDLDRREVALLDAVGDGDFRCEIASMAREINARGVAPLDIKLGNFIRGAITGRLYWIDFELSRLSSQPRWEMDLAAQHETLERLFGIARACERYACGSRGRRESPPGTRPIKENS